VGTIGREPNPKKELQLRNTTFISSMVLSVACVSAANAGVVDPFTVGSTASANFVYTLTPITGGLWDTRNTYVGYRASNASASMTVNSQSQSATFQVTRNGGASNGYSQEGNLEYFDDVGVTDVSNFTSLTFDYTSTFSSLEFYINLGGKEATKTISASAGGTFTLTAAELNGAFDGAGYMNLLFRQRLSNASGTFTLTNLVANGVPAPGALALLGAAGLVGARRRRA
jgi:MYXO-CTERM domain-containing protein